MRDDLAEIAVVIDESGSMQGLTDDTIGGFNQFLTEQKAVPGSAKLTVVKFNTVSTKLHDGVDLKDVPPLSHDTYTPKGYTALYDAVAEAINSVGERLAAMPEDQRPGKVIMAILTDGQENSSKEYNQGRLAAMIKEQTEKYSWNFMFLAANQDAWEAGGSIGVQHCFNYTANSRGVADSYRASSSYTASVRTNTNISTN